MKTAWGPTAKRIRVNILPTNCIEDLNCIKTYQQRLNLQLFEIYTWKQKRHQEKWKLCK